MQRAQRVLPGDSLRRVDDLRTPRFVRRTRADVLPRQRLPGRPLVQRRHLRHLRRNRSALLSGQHLQQRKHVRRRRLSVASSLRRRRPGVLRSRVRSGPDVRDDGHNDALPALDDLRRDGTGVLRWLDVQRGPRVQRHHMRHAHGRLRQHRSAVLRRQRVRRRTSMPERPLHLVPRRRNHLRNQR